MAMDFQSILSSLGLGFLLGGSPEAAPTTGLLSSNLADATPQQKPPVPKIEIDRLKNAIVQVETGGEKDPYIFTRQKGGKSSAFGPAQITYTLAEDVLRRNPEIRNDPNLNAYINDFISQGKQRINQYSKNPRAVSPSLKSGASGLISKARHKKYYPILFDKAFNIKAANELSPSTIAEKWYGNKSAALNKAYADKVMSFYTGD